MSWSESERRVERVGGPYFELAAGVGRFRRVETEDVGEGTRDVGLDALLLVQQQRRSDELLGNRRERVCLHEVLVQRLELLVQRAGALEQLGVRAVSQRLAELEARHHVSAAAARVFAGARDGRRKLSAKSRFAGRLAWLLRLVSHRMAPKAASKAAPAKTVAVKAAPAPVDNRTLSAKDTVLFKSVLTLYEQHAWKKGIKSADLILKNNPEHGGQQRPCAGSQR